MRRKFETRLIVGVLIWIGLIGAGIFFSRNLSSDSSEAPAQIASYFTTPKRTIEVRFDRLQSIKVGDPIFNSADGLAKPIGRIKHVQSRSSTETEIAFTDIAFVELFANAPEIRAGHTVTFHRTPDSMAWVVQMMLPPATRDKIGGLILTAFRDHQQEIVDALRPVVEDSIRDASEVIREDLNAAFKKRESQLTLIGERFQNELVEQELVPLVQNEIWPVVKKQSEPLVSEIGQEIWDEVSVWRFTWKYLYDQSPLPERNLTEKEFTRFVNDKAVPILENHMSDIVTLQQKILTDVANNPNVRETVSQSIREVAQDPDVQALFTEVFREVFIDNQRLQNKLKENWNTPEAQAALQLTNRKLDPTISAIGETLFGSPYKEITPEFSRVLRNKILEKDSRWMVLHGDVDETRTTRPEFLLATPGETSTEMPNFSIEEKATELTPAKPDKSSTTGTGR